MNPKIILASIGVFLALVCGSGTSIANANGRGEHPRGEVLDGRYNHGRFYPPLGAVRSALPSEYRPYFHGTERFYFSAGVWYAPRGEGFVVVRPPRGIGSCGAAALLLNRVDWQQSLLLRQ